MSSQNSLLQDYVTEKRYINDVFLYALNNDRVAEFVALFPNFNNEFDKNRVQAILSQPIEVLGLSMRMNESLKLNKISRVIDLVCLSPQRFKQLGGVGEATQKAVTNRLAAFGKQYNLDLAVGVRPFNC